MLGKDKLFEIAKNFEIVKEKGLTVRDFNYSHLISAKKQEMLTYFERKDGMYVEIRVHRNGDEIHVKEIKDYNDGKGAYEIKTLQRGWVLD